LPWLFSFLGISGLVAGLEPFQDRFPFADIGGDGVSGDADRGPHPDHDPYRVGGGLNAKARKRRQMAIERAVVPEIRLAASNAAIELRGQSPQFPNSPIAIQISRF
jgi:hypothetical protein